MVFVGDEVQLDVSFAVARERLLQLAEGGVLLSTSQDAYDDGSTGFERVGIPGLSKLVRYGPRSGLDGPNCRASHPLGSHGTGRRALPDPGCCIKLAPAGEHVTVLTVTGAYRPPLGALGEALDRMILHRVAAATIRGFAARVAARITGEPGAAAAAAPNGAGASPPPEVPGPALGRCGPPRSRNVIRPRPDPRLTSKNRSFVARRRTRSRGSRGSSRLAGPAPR